MIQDRIEQEIGFFTRCGVPALMQHFVARNGVVCTAQALPARVHRGAAKECFMNALKLAIADTSLTYVEGLALPGGLPLLVHHAWCVDQTNRVVDPTWDKPEAAEYMGVRFETDRTRRLVLEQGYYGLLDTGRGLNHKLMFSIDAGLEALVIRRA